MKNPTNTNKNLNEKFRFFYWQNFQEKELFESFKEQSYIRLSKNKQVQEEFQKRYGKLWERVFSSVCWKIYLKNRLKEQKKIPYENFKYYS